MFEVNSVWLMKTKVRSLVSFVIEKLFLSLKVEYSKRVCYTYTKMEIGSKQ